jgi:hypothetical protein
VKDLLEPEHILLLIIGGVILLMILVGVLAAGLLIARRYLSKLSKEAETLTDRHTSFMKKLDEHYLKVVAAADQNVRTAAHVAEKYTSLDARVVKLEQAIKTIKEHLGMIPV